MEGMKMLILKHDSSGVQPLYKTGEELLDYLTDNSSKKGEVQEALTAVKSGMIVKSEDLLTWVMSDGSVDRANEICDQGYTQK